MRWSQSSRELTKGDEAEGGEWRGEGRRGSRGDEGNDGRMVGRLGRVGWVERGMLEVKLG